MFQDRPLIASVSGGKDSTAVMLYLREKGMNFTPVFCDTGWEHPITYDYLSYLEKALDVDIVRVRNEKYFDTDGGGLCLSSEKRSILPITANSHLYAKTQSKAHSRLSRRS